MKKVIFLLLMVALCLSACSDQKEQGPEILVLATFQENPELHRQVDLFNQNHKDYQIEIQNYQRSLQKEEDGIAMLQREIISGRGPDLIDFGAEYATSDILGGYTENLMPYLKAEAAENQEEYFTNILESFCYNGKLYAMPVSFILDTFAGSKKTLGDREYWNVREMMACYRERPKGTMLYPGETKSDVFSRIILGSMEYFIDWENGTCSFEQEEFKDMLAFANMFPDTLQLDEDFSVKQTFLDGDALIIPTRIAGIYEISRAEYIFGDTDICYIGYPMEGVSGTVISPDAPMLAISIGSEHKEVCWEFIGQYLDRDYQKTLGLPVNKKAMEEKLAESLTPEYTVDENGDRKPVVKSQVAFAGEESADNIYCLTKEQTIRLMHLIESAEINDANDYHLFRIIYEEAESYFSGDKTLEEVTEIIQSRASVYVSEKSK